MVLLLRVRSAAVIVIAAAAQVASRAWAPCWPGATTSMPPGGGWL
eukprot:SAG22_NODE_5341_length_1033_cov_1.344754_1_plen_45_part_00